MEERIIEQATYLTLKLVTDFVSIINGIFPQYGIWRDIYISIYSLPLSRYSNLVATAGIVEVILEVIAVAAFEAGSVMDLVRFCARAVGIYELPGEITTLTA